ncbi:ras-related protein Rap-2a [Apteryx rowi]|nr:ras-related protein Rap-2a [Apteryx rowi]
METPASCRLVSRRRGKVAPWIWQYRSEPARQRASSVNVPRVGSRGKRLAVFLHRNACPRIETCLCVCLRRYEKVPVILVGNKVDLESEREVSSNEGRALAEEWGCPFMETSAKSKTMVDELFAEIVRQMNYAAQPDKDDPCCSACNIQ